MKCMSKSSILMVLWLCAFPGFAAAAKLDTAHIDAALGRTGSWVEGVYLVNFPRPELHVTLQGVQLSDLQVLSFVTFVGSGAHAEMMGEICALPDEVTPAIIKLRAGGIQITGVHDHYIGESPRIVFIHFMARGTAQTLAQTYRSALAVTGTPLGRTSPDFSVGPLPDWAKTVQHAFGRAGGYFMPKPETMEFDIASTHFPASPMQDFWSSVVYFQPAPDGKLATTGDIMVTAPELNPVLSILTQNRFQILAVHNHMIDEHPRVFFIHFWKIAAPQDVSTGLKAALAEAHARP